jgi:DNA-binding LacI/PurR family transcriptional regulator/DNA-binding FadR family transcriptional regulator
MSNSVILAVRHLEQLCEQTRADKRERLPTVKAICASGRFSPATVLTALGKLQQAGVVRVVPRGGIFVTGVVVSLPSEPPSPKPAPAPRRWEAARAALAEDLLSGFFQPGSQLPPVKLLAARYGACYATLRKALAALAADRRVEWQRNGFRAAQSANRTPAATLVLVTCMRNTAGLARYNSRSTEFWRTLESECLRLDLTLSIRHTDEALAAAPAHACATGAVVGFTVLTTGWQQTELPALQGLLEHLGRSGRPVALMDDDGRLDIPALARSVARFPAIRFLTMGVDHTSGRIVGEYLLGLGHRRVACFSLVDTSIWCRNRAAGIEAAFRAAGVVDGVVRCTMPQYQTLEQIELDLARQPRFRALEQQVRRFHASAGVPGRALGDYFFDPHVHFYLWLRFMQAQMRDLMDRTLADRSITAWAAVTDMVAFIALEHLHERRVAVPTDLSVVGFDDLPEAFGSGVSSYNFNVPATVQAMLRHLLRGRGRGREGPAVLEVPGRVMARSTSGPARR